MVPPSRSRPTTSRSISTGGTPITYDNATPLTTQGGTFNGGFETGNFSGWNVRQPLLLRWFPRWRCWQLDGRVDELHIDPDDDLQTRVTIPQANVSYMASLTCGGTWGAR